MPRSFRHVVIAAFLLLGLSGCVQEDVNGSTITFTYAFWVPLLTLLGGLVAAPAGWYLRSKSARFGWGLLIISPIVVAGIAPSLYLDRADIDDTHFSLRTGIWGMTAVHDVKFNDLSRVRLILEESTGRRGSKRINYYLLCERKDGTSAKVPLGNKVAETAAPYLVARVKALNVPLVDETGENVF
jgi:hypothetical protein